MTPSGPLQPDTLDASHTKTVQQYIDEAPIWPDGTAVAVSPMTAMQWRIWWLAAAGKFFEGLVVFMTGVALPLIADEFGLDALQHGVVGAATLFGILIGATALGGLADRLGRRFMFIIEMGIFTAFLMLLALSPSYHWLVVFLFGLGVALGCDYPTAHLIISESIPTRARGRLVVGAFGFQALGVLAGTALGYLILSDNPSLSAWRWMYASAIVPALLVLLGRFSITESGHWLVSRGRTEEAERETRKLLGRTPPYPRLVKLADGAAPHHSGGTRGSYLTLFSPRCRRATILAAVPWFLQDLATYGIGIFTPTILARTIGQEKAHAQYLADIIHNDLIAAKGAAFIDVLLLVGIVAAVLLSDRVSRISLQIAGFVGCALGLFLATLSLDSDGNTKTALIFAGFMLFSFMTNMGPNAQTYLLAGEVFPTHVRGKGAGFAASFAKIGAVATAFLFPVVLVDLGTRSLLYILIGTSLLGAVVTWLFRIETTGTSLEHVGRDVV